MLGLELELGLAPGLRRESDLSSSHTSANVSKPALVLVLALALASVLALALVPLPCAAEVAVSCGWSCGLPLTCFFTPWNRLNVSCRVNGEVRCVSVY